MEACTQRSRRGPRATALATAPMAALMAALTTATPAWAVDYCYLYQGQGYSCEAAEVWPDLRIAGESYELDKGIYRANSLLVGGTPPGVVLQSGGVNTVRTSLRLGWNTGHVGSYHMHAGLLSTASTTVGHRGSATMVQLAGTHIASTALDIGLDGRYALGGGLVHTPVLSVSGEWRQTGGQLIVDTAAQFGGGDLWLQGGRMQLPAHTQVGYSRLQVDAGEMVLAGPLQLGSDNSGVSSFTAVLRLYGGVVHGDIEAGYGGIVVGGGGQLTGHLQLRGRSDLRTLAHSSTTLGSLDAGALSRLQLAGTLTIGKALGLQQHSTLALEGSTLSAGQAIANHGTVSGHGRLQAPSMAGSGSLTPAGGDLVLALPGGSSLAGPIVLEQGRRLTLEGGDLTVLGFMAMQGATTDGSGMLRIATGARLRGPGTISTRLTMDGTLELPQGRLLIEPHWANHGLVVLDTAGELSGGRVDNRGTLLNLGRVLAPVRNQGLVQLQGGSFMQSLSTDPGGRLRVLAAGEAAASLGGLVMAAGAAPVEVEFGAQLLVDGDAALAAGSAFVGAGSVRFAGSLDIAGSGIGGVLGNAALLLAPSARLTLDLAGTGAQQYDQVGTLSDLVFGGTLALRLAGGYSPVLGDSFALLGGVLSGQFAAVDTTLAPLAAGLVWDSTRLVSDGVVSVTAVPEPSSSALVLAGALGLLARRRFTRPGARAAMP